MPSQTHSVSSAPSTVIIRRANPKDAAVCGQICYEAFAKINADHGFPPDFRVPEEAIALLSRLFSHPGFHCVVAELEGRIVGSNCLDERSPITSVGPITIDPSVQNRGAGRKLMQAVLHQARERQRPGVRLVQMAFNNRSLSLYASLGFQAQEPLSVMQGPPMGLQFKGCSVRAARVTDVDQCNRVCSQVHGHDRAGQLTDVIGDGAVVVEREGRITGYATGLSFFGHAVAESLLDLQALIASAESFKGPGILVPTRNSELFRWCLSNKLRVVEPATLMTLGVYNKPTGAYLPSIGY